ncbi:hypothetical protein C8Q76DRAFT_609451 [Earliella scabrosa]|nr:hypothetical protein C8Q76DRAFT_609451 [Earliella scabrosa]
MASNTGTPIHPRICVFCGQLAYTWCSRCCASWYCSQSHLNNDWPRHRQFCIPYKISSSVEGTMALVPSGEAVTSGFVFWCNAVFYVPVHSISQAGVADCMPIPRLTPFFPDGPPIELVLEKGLHGVHMRYPLSLWYSPHAFEQKESQNQAVSALVKHVVHRPWYGTLVVLKYSGSRRRLFANVCDLDLGALSAFFMDLAI